MVNDYQIGTTVTLSIEYLNQAGGAQDPDSNPVVDVLDKNLVKIQTNVETTKTGTGKYTAQFMSAGFAEGIYYDQWTASFSGLTSIKSGSFMLKKVSV